MQQWCFYEINQGSEPHHQKRSGESTLHHSLTEKRFNIYSEYGRITVIIKEHLHAKDTKMMKTI